jgi:D-3-phosphoglycerate dehydrogenase
MNGTILFADPYADDLLQSLASVGWPVVNASMASRLDLLSWVSEAEILVVRSRTVVNETLVKNAPLLKLVIRGGSGSEHIDKQALSKRNIQLITTPEANRDAVGEQAVGMLLGLLNNIYRADRSMRQFEWKRMENKGYELASRTIGIIGYGNTGQAFARKLSGFGAKVIAFDKYKEGFSDQFADEVSLQELQERADVLSFHVPLTDETRYYLDYSFVQAMKNRFWLLNLSRGEVVHTTALITGLNEGKILGAGLDVFENEQFSFLTEIQAYELKALFERDNVIVTPHIGGVTVESEARIIYMVRKAIADYIVVHYGS